jgi:Flp pilus assembly protein TadG
MGATRSGPRDGDQRGAALIEFAILTPLLVLLVFGIIEFGWLFGQFNDIRHASREGARFAAVNGGSETEIAQRVCDTVEGFGAGIESVDVILDAGGGSKGSMASISVVADIGSLTNAPIISVFTPDSLRSDVTFRLERDVTWNSTTMADTC